MSEFLVIGGTRVPIAAPRGADEEYQELGGEVVRSFSGRLLSTVKGRARVWRLQTIPLPDTEAQLLAAALTGGVPLACSGALIGGEVMAYARGVRTRPVPRSQRVVDFELHEADAPRARLLWRWSARHPYPPLTTTRQSPATSRDRTGILRTAAPGVLRLDWRDGRPYALVEPAATNLVLGSSDFVVGAGSRWGPGNGLTVTPAASAIAGQTAYRHVNSGAAGSRNRSQRVGDFSGQPETAYIIVERLTATHTSLGLYDSSTSSFAGRMTLNWITGAVSVTGDGTAAAIRLSDQGPNGGPLYLLAVTTAGMAGNPRHFFIYPTGVDPNTHAAILHHAQLVESTYWSSPIVTGGAPTTRDRDLVSTDYAHPPGSCAVYEAGIEAGAGSIVNARAWQIGAGTAIEWRSLQVLHWQSTPGLYTLMLGGGAGAYVRSQVPTPPLGAEYLRLALLDVDEATAQARVRLLQRHREGGAWVDADGGWSPWLDVSELLALGWQSPHLTIGNVREGTRAGRLQLSDLIALDIAGLDAERITIDDAVRLAL